MKLLHSHGYLTLHQYYTTSRVNKSIVSLHFLFLNRANPNSF